MASRTMYPPIVSSAEPAFVAGSDLKVYFSFSSLGSYDKNELTAHVQIYRQDGIKVLKEYFKDQNSDGKVISICSPTGIIIDSEIYKEDENKYYVIIKNEYLKSSLNNQMEEQINGWIPGWVYKIQLRLSQKKYSDGDLAEDHELWLKKNSSFFSEWSTICYTKAISSIDVKVPLFDKFMKKNEPYNPEMVVTLSDVDFSGSIEARLPESNEYYDYVNISLYKGDLLIEESGELYRTEQSNTYFSYRFKYNFIDDEQYKITLFYVTENGYCPKEPYEYNFIYSTLPLDVCPATVHTVDLTPSMSDITSIEEEEEEGRIGIKLLSPDSSPWSGNLCIRRASAEDGYNAWTDIETIVVKNEDINNLPLIYDYTIQSGVWYKYGVQVITKFGERGILNTAETPISRLFNNSYLLGFGGKQLKLAFNQTVSNFKSQIYDSKTDTIGSKYPFIDRNAQVDYKTFPMSFLISYNMDDKNTFASLDRDSITYIEPSEGAEKEPLVDMRYTYDYTYESKFRNAVMDFLKDGKPKLYKSPTEGNIIVRLTDVSYTPEQKLDRLIYSVNLNAHEIDECNMDNYIKYGFYNPGSYATDFSTLTYHIGQIDGKFKLGDEILTKIYEKYDSQDKNYGGYSKKLREVRSLFITINGYYYQAEGEEVFVPGHQTRVYLGSKADGEPIYARGNRIRVNDNNIIIYDTRGMYEFDDLIIFHYGEDKIYFPNDSNEEREDSLISGVDATIDFVYGLVTDVYEAKKIIFREGHRAMGQVYGEMSPGKSVYDLIYFKYYFETEEKFSRLNYISSIEIEADPHTIFEIKDEEDREYQQHEVNDTGILRLYELSNIVDIRYVGRRKLNTPYDDSTLSKEIYTEDTEDFRASTDALITYRCVYLTGRYESKEQNG